jgi:hypothetical protein
MQHISLAQTGGLHKIFSGLLDTLCYRHSNHALFNVFIHILTFQGSNNYSMPLEEGVTSCGATAQAEAERSARQNEELQGLVRIREGQQGQGRVIGRMAPR